MVLMSLKDVNKVSVCREDGSGMPVVLVDGGSLVSAVEGNVRYYKELMYLEEDRELYNFYSGCRSSLIDFFNLDDEV